MEKIGFVVIVIIALISLAFLFAKLVLDICTLKFDGEKYIIPFRDHKCPVVVFGNKTYRKDNNMNWFLENHFTLNEITWATKTSHKVMDVLSEIYLKIVSTKFILLVIGIYFLFVYASLLFKEILIANLHLLLFFWVGLLFLVTMKELLEKIKTPTYRNIF